MSGYFLSSFKACVQNTSDMFTLPESLFPELDYLTQNNDSTLDTENNLSDIYFDEIGGVRGSIKTVYGYCINQW